MFIRRTRRFVADRRILERNSTLVHVDQPGIGHSGQRSDVAPYVYHTGEQGFHGQLLWSDFHWSQLDAKQPQDRRDIEVSVQQTVADASDKFAGVIRVGLLAEQLDRAVHLKLTSAKENDPHRIFLCDRDGRLITRGVGSDRERFRAMICALLRLTLLPKLLVRSPNLSCSQSASNTPVVSGNFRQNGQ